MKKSKLSLKGKSTSSKFRTENDVKENQAAAAAPTLSDNRPAQFLAELNTSSRSSGLNCELNGLDDHESRYYNCKIDCEWVPIPTFQSLLEEIKINTNETVLETEENCSLPSAVTIPEKWVPLPKSCRKCLINQFLKVKLIKCDEDENFKTTSVPPTELMKIGYTENLTIGPSKSIRINGPELAILKDRHDSRNISGRMEKTSGSLTLTKTNDDRVESKQLTTFKENPSKVLPASKHLNKRKPPQSSSSHTLQASKRIRMEQAQVSDNGNSSSGVIGSSKGQTPANEILTQCPMCSSDFDYRMTQMEIDQHIARCLSAVDDDVVW